jgi:uncharacterized membrane protein
VRVSRRILGLVPRQLVGVSTLVSALLLTGWGRIDWAEPSLAVANVVAFVTTSIGAALGDLLPGS